MINRIFSSCALGALLALAGLPRTADAALPAESLRHQELRQEQLRITTQRVGGQLDTIIDEYQRNGLVGDDVVVLKAIRTVLGRLSEQDMQRVVALLQSARTLEDFAESRRNAVDAFAGQKGVTVQLRQLLLEYQRQQALQEIAARFAALSRRQGENLRESVALAGLTRGRDARRSDDSHRLALQLQETEQSALGDEVKSVVTKLAKVVADMDGVAAERPRTALQRSEAGRLLPTMDAATAELKVANLLSAAGNEKRARDLLNELARLLAPARDTLEMLRQAVRELEAAMEQQAQVADQTKTLPTRRPETAEVERKQAEVVDRTDSVREDVQGTAPKAAQDLKAAIEKMQEARALLNDPESRRRGENPLETTRARQAEALASMDSARQDLMEQLARAEAKAEQPKDKVAELKELLKEVQELSKQQAEVKAAAAKAAPQPEKLPAHATAQESVKARTQQAQSTAAPIAPDAARSLGEAAQQMEKSEQALARKANAPLAQQAAADALQKATQQIEAQISKLDQARQDLAKLEKLNQDIGKLIQGQQRVQADTAKVAAQPAAKPDPQMARDQGQLAKGAEQTKLDAADTAPEAASPLGEAARRMTAAQGELDKPDAPKARPEQAMALDHLHEARRAVENKMNELAAQLGQPMNSQNLPQMAKAAETVMAAQQQVNKAVAQLDQPASLAAQLKQQQKQIAAAVERKSQATPQSKPVAAAKDAAKSAARKLDENDLKGAIGEMARAQQSLQQAAGESGEPKPTSGAPSAKPPAPPGGNPPPGAKPNPPGKAAGEPSLPQLAQQQADVKQMAELLAGMQPQQAAIPLDIANEMISPLTAGEAGALPQMAQQALMRAQQALTEAAAQASANQASPAQMNAEAAQQALAQAAAVLALAQEGIGNQMAQQAQGQNGKGQSQQQGKGQAKGPGQGKAKADSKEGQGDGKEGNWAGQGGPDGNRRDTKGTSGFLGLPARDRNAILQSQTERAPEEYSPLVEQYLKNLSDSAGQRPKGK